jgi:integrase
LKQKSLEDVNWEDPVLKRWLGGIVNKSTLYNAKSAFRLYAQFTGKTASELIDEAIEDNRRDPREKQDIVLRQLIGFYKWLTTEYKKKRAVGTGKVKETKKGLSGLSAEMRVNVIRGFYGTFDITVRLKGRYRLPKSKVENKRIIFKPEDIWKVKALVDHARTPRDRAIVLFHFQGGLDVSTLCSLNYGDVKEGLEKDEHPLKVEPMRVKTGVEFYTFVGDDAIDALKAYLDDMKSRGVEFNDRTPLFLQERGKGRINTHNIQVMMKDLVVRSGLVDEANNGYAFNPLGTHSLRESFGSLMINSRVPDTIVDFWLGHEIGDLARAYKTTQFESLKKMYAERESLLSITAPREDEKTKAELSNLRGEFSVLSKGTESITRKIAEVERENKELKREVAEQKAEFEKEIAGLNDSIKYHVKNFEKAISIVDALYKVEGGPEALLKARDKIVEERQEKILKADREPED